jgi:hypothetical protein
MVNALCKWLACVLTLWPTGLGELTIGGILSMDLFG